MLMSAFTAESIWETYSKTKDITIRNKLVMQYAGLVKSIVLKMRDVCGKAEVEDLINHGIITLMECIDRFDYKRDIKFETFASIRIRGAVIDYVRKQDWVPRNLRKSAKMVEEVYMSIDITEDDSERIEEKVAAHLGTTVENVRRLMNEISKFNIISYEELVYNSLSGEHIELPDLSKMGSPDEELLKREFSEKLTQALSNLTNKERLILSLYYSELLRLKEIAKIFEVTESRICQLHSKALKKIKEELKEYLK